MQWHDFKLSVSVYFWNTKTVSQITYSYVQQNIHFSLDYLFSHPNVFSFQLYDLDSSIEKSLFVVAFYLGP